MPLRRIEDRLHDPERQPTPEEDEQIPSPIEGLIIEQDDEEQVRAQIEDFERRKEQLKKAIADTESRLEEARAALGLEISEAPQSIDQQKRQILNLEMTIKILRAKLINRKEKRQPTPEKKEQGSTDELPVQPLATKKQLYENLDAVLSPQEVISFKYIYANTLGAPTEKNLQNLHGTENWQSKGWEYYRLAGREGLIKENFPVLLERDPSKTSMVDRATSLASAAIEFQHKVATKTLSHEATAVVTHLNRDVLEQSQYERFFSSSRIPGERVDRLHIESESGNYFMIMIEGRYIRIDGKKDGKPLSPEELRSQIAAAVEAVQKLEPVVPVGAVSAGQRKKAAHFREKLLKDEENQALQREVEQALFVMCLDPDAHPESLSDQMSYVRDGGGTYHRNREFNKGVQIIVGGDDEQGVIAGFSFEHALIDGTNGARFSTDVQRSAKYVTFSDEMIPVDPSSIVVKEWNLTEELKSEAITIDQEVVQKLETKKEDAFELRGDWLDVFKRNGIRPDTGFQLALQLATFLQYQEALSNSEQVSVRHFKDGRINPTLVTTQALKEFVSFLTDKRAETPIEDWREHLQRGYGAVNRVVEMLQAAIEKHEEIIRNAKAGYGTETHLMAHWSALHPGSIEVSAEAQTAADMVFSQPIMGVRGYLQPHIVSSNLRYIGEQGEIAAAGTVPSRRPEGTIALGYIFKKNRIIIDVRSEGKYKDYGDEIKPYLYEALETIKLLAPHFAKLKETQEKVDPSSPNEISEKI